MSRTQRTITIPITLTLILITAAIGAWLGTVSSQEWDTFLAQIQNMGNHAISLASASPSQTTMYVFDADQPTTREIIVDLWICDGRRSGNKIVPILLTAERGAVEMPLTNDLALRMELISHNTNAPDELQPFPPSSPFKVAER